MASCSVRNLDDVYAMMLSWMENHILILEPEASLVFERIELCTKIIIHNWETNTIYIPCQFLDIGASRDAEMIYSSRPLG